MKKANLIYNYCKWGDVDSLNIVLSSNIDLDVLSDDGLYFWLAAQNKDIAVATSIICTLLDYYTEKYLQGDHDSIEYKLNRHKLQEALIEQFEDTDLPQEIFNLLEPYIGGVIGHNDEDTDQDLSDELDMLELGSHTPNAFENTPWNNLNHGQDQDHLLHNQNNHGLETHLLGDHGAIHTK